MLNKSGEYVCLSLSLTVDVGVSLMSLNNGFVREFPQCFHVSA